MTTYVRGTYLDWLMNGSISSTILLLCAVYCIYYTCRKYLDYHADLTFGASHGCAPPPQLPNHWPLGIDRLKQLWDSDSDGQLLPFLCSVALDYEPQNMLSQYLLFGPRVWHILRPENVEAVLSSNFKGQSAPSKPLSPLLIDLKDYSFGDRAGVFAPLLGNGIFTQEGEAWKHSRELLRKQFVRTQYQNMNQFTEHVDNLISLLPVDGIVDLQPLFFDFTLDITTALLLGRSVHSLKPEIADKTGNKAFADNFSIAQKGLARRFRLAPWHFFYSPPEFRRACSEVHHFVENYIRELKLSDQKQDLDESDGFIRQVAQESATIEDLRDQLLNVLLAGRDTSACCLSWTIRLLVRHTEVMDRLRKEISSVVRLSEHPTREQLRKMPYLDCVIKESLRLYPPVPLNNRCATKTTILPTGGGSDGNSPILVRKGEVVIMSQYVMSRKRNIYGADADDFRPERWETGELANIGWAYTPFNGGPRTCLGQDFVLMEIAYTVVRLLNACPVIALPAGEKNEPPGTEKQLLTLVLSSRDGCRVQINR